MIMIVMKKLYYIFNVLNLKKDINKKMFFLCYENCVYLYFFENFLKYIFLSYRMLSTECKKSFESGGEKF